MAPRHEGQALLEQVRGAFFGLDTRYLTSSGTVTRRVYLDSAASTLMLAPAFEVGREFLAHYANVHTEVHFSASMAAQALEHARRTVLDFLGADPAHYVCVFAGSGSTAAINHAARYLCQYRPGGDTVVASLLEHHSNDLPHRRASSVIHLSPSGPRSASGPVSPRDLRRVLRAHRPVRYAALSLTSNVTGIVNDIAALTATAHAEGVPVLVDAAQAAAHLPICLDDWGRPDAVALSGHKIYAPGSPGVLVIRRDILDHAAPAELGGGMVDDVRRTSYAVLGSLPERVEAGTPNIYGAVVLAAALTILRRIGMKHVHDYEQTLTRYLLQGLTTVPGIHVYGSTDLSQAPRIGVVAFNCDGLDHGFAAAMLNDHHNIAVRNGCFCAHPYVRSLLAPELWDIETHNGAAELAETVRMRSGMIRASTGLYSTREDIDLMISALHHITTHADKHLPEYDRTSRGTYHAATRPTPRFDGDAIVLRALQTCLDTAPR